MGTVWGGEQGRHCGDTLPCSPWLCVGLPPCRRLTAELCIGAATRSAPLPGLGLCPGPPPHIHLHHPTPAPALPHIPA